ncbi:hypothetical protein EI545_10915 [Tabrizicola piscis]|uniref:Uncharacterized protein n=1 Tax=Tabrizicola piscis TaxID=2494374 RepID=A0A3S8U6K7_9RHOB|nr:hypothetical protein [Tabrizicola piscis]AZL59312.1 hypothetical protein EI545_10915 [Tabrizicola piscis]
MSPWYDEPIILGVSAAQLWLFVSPLLAGAIGAWLTRWFRKKDDREARRTEFVANKYQEAYFLVCEALEHPGMAPEEAFNRKLKLERAFNTLDLYADLKTRESAKAVSEAFARNADWISYEPLLTALRDSFRERLGLEKLNDPVRTLKFGLILEGQNTPASTEPAETAPKGGS